MIFAPQTCLINSLLLACRSGADSELCVRGEHGLRDSPRHERPLARPRKQVEEGDKDDEPTYVVEESQDTLSKAECEALVTTNDADEQKENSMPSSTEVRYGSEEAEPRKDKVFRGAAPAKQQVAGIGCSNKRRLAKIVGDEGENEVPLEESGSRKKQEETKVKKGKKIKLSFDEGTES